MTDLETTKRRRELVSRVVNTITGKDERSKQKSIGPSEIGNPCAYCVGKALCRKYPELWWELDSTPWDDSFSLKAWVGTAVHEKLEKDHPYGVKEETFVVYELSDYGQITGHVDLVDEYTVWDHKTSDLDKIREYKLSGPPIRYQGQAQVYGKGVEDAGHAVKDICLFFIPRDSNSVKDCWPAFGAYNRKAAERVLTRLEKIWRTVQDGRGSELPQESGCWGCDSMYEIIGLKERA